MSKVSAVLITYNEEKNLRVLLPKLSWCDEIVVVDSGSNDQTITVCESFHCEIYFRKFEGYGAQKRFAVSLAKNDWILCLDADEIPSDELIAEIIAELKSPCAQAYQLPLVFVFMQTPFKFGKESWRYFPRLFNRNYGNFSIDKVHEGIQINGSVKRLKGCVMHYSYRDFAQYFDKFNRYTSLGAELSFAHGKRKSLVAVVFALPWNFTKYYLLDRNFLNGWNGFYWSVFGAFYHFVKYLKIRELQAAHGKLNIAEAPAKEIIPQ